MDADKKNRTTIERTSDCEIVITRTFDAPARLVFQAWTRAELMKQWWVPKSIPMQLLSCETDVRVGGTYKFVFRHGEGEMAFHGKYLEVVTNERLVWTNDEGDDGGHTTTLVFEDQGEKTLLVMTERYPSKAALEASAGAEEGLPEQHAQLDELLATIRAQS